MKALNLIAYILVIIGGLNWGLTALGYFVGGDWNVVKLILGSVPAIENIVYLLVGLSAIVLLFTNKQESSTSAAQGI
ncbi:hypothetical protein A3G63_03515 [Candidatus Kaiserbacteria bacterium RIFCSPLOWO2_12_FULL_52_8]|uniref:DUF378 domain-containing protein n=1 Tax=Candidatus Kaiserbacteria bacterium RIFCSPHIGHO2_01_FULL_53_31 TaxID=1798481 RepID=A0A1F6CH20_9BACT|nr:MAG: hypothetical protein A2678_00165 [Candidatus Kaiserbacteria bacterium RIFCSPHIGHO2_01_FULL_53_31]OGG92821.1 MAG: hypothetical protein A3G63_03515 [Candidatus Kaiserbacteria bacterium RIFCSPLOWO2_12_FULL_52_8]